MKLIEEYQRKIPYKDVMDILHLLTSYHRLQGSRELWESVKKLSEYLGEKGIPSRIYRVDEGVSKGFIKTPISWDPLEAYLEIKTSDKIIAKLTLDKHPTLLAAHSPSGEGCGELVICREDKCSGEAVLATGYLYDLYLNTDARLILYYSESRYHSAVPYTGLFIEPGEEKDRVVMNIPYNLAVKLIHLKTLNPRRRITVCWKAVTRRHKLGLPILVSCKGSDPGVVFISHICHPKPGAHDNASGSTVNALIALTLDRVNLDYSYCNVWVPEYTGTVFLWDKTPWKPVAVLNLDMVGSKQYVTGSVLTMVNPPRYIQWSYTPLLWVTLKTVMDNTSSYPGFSEPGVKWGVSPYGMGSDHDVYVSWGFEAVMLNEWPSKYYHTDMDTPDTISPINLVQTSIVAMVSTHLFLNSDRERIEYYWRIYESYLRSIYAVEALKKGLSLNNVSRNLLKKPVITEPPEKPLLETPFTGRSLYKILGREKYLEIRRIKHVYDALGVYLPVAYLAGIKDPLKHYKAERLVKWSRREERIVRDAWMIVKQYIG